MSGETILPSIRRHQSADNQEFCRKDFQSPSASSVIADDAPSSPVKAYFSGDTSGRAIRTTGYAVSDARTNP
ncbi:hypothetical protein TH24_05900 [Thalassospira xiamenensis]|nr:hypothetical protein TH24_05900 [Thalassospira xiamenensis]